MTEREFAIVLANKVLDRRSGDPDDDLAVLARQFLRVLEDSARLDWLDEVNRRTNERNKTTYGWRYDINHNRSALMDHNFPALSIRAAIDEAKNVNVKAARHVQEASR